MEKITRYVTVHRVIALMLLFMLIFSLIPVSSSIKVKATTEYPDAIVITVTDEDGNPLKEATVEYTINSISDGDNKYIGNETTDANGVIVVLNSEDYVAGDLSISATIAKTGYQTDSTSIADTMIVSANQNIQVTLISSVISDVSVIALNSRYNRNWQNLVSVSGTRTGDLVLYSTDGINWNNEVPQEINAGEYSVYVKVERAGCTDYESGKLTAKIDKEDITGISIEAYIGAYDAGSHKIVSITGLETNDEVTVTYNSIDYTYVYGAGEDTIPEITNVSSDYDFNVKVHRSNNYNDYFVNETAIIESVDIEGLSATLKNGLVYNGEEQALVASAEGTKEGDVVEYKVDNGDWSTIEPKRIEANT